MSMSKLILPGERELEVEEGTPISEIAPQLHKKGVGHAVAAKLDGQLVDLATPIPTGEHQLELICLNSDAGREILNHSATHIMAEAVLTLFPNAKNVHGPATPEGFFYDFAVDEPFSKEDVDKINQLVQQIVKEKRPFKRVTWTRAKAREYYAKNGNALKVEIIDDIEDEEVTFYDQGKFIDMCKGPHLPLSGKIGGIKILNAGAVFWKGDNTREVLQRVYGVAFPDRKQLKKHLSMLEEAKKRDHRKLGLQLDLFSTAEEFGPGLVMFHPKGALMLDVMERWWRDMHRRHGYDLVRTPHLYKAETWKITGHYEHFKENMFFTTIDDDEYAIKPMNCPGHAMIYNKRTYSYKDLPVRMAEWGVVYRNEMSGVLHGLTRVRSITQDDAHIMLMAEGIEEEVNKILDIVAETYTVFSLEEWQVAVSTRPDKAIGSDELWETATNALYGALKTRGVTYRIDEGEGAFYGPKIDIHLKDAIGRFWQCATIQVDFNLGPRFNMTYVGEDGQKHHPVVIHRVIFGALERFVALIVEHTAGRLPLWVTPVQAIVIPITDRNNEYCKQVADELNKLGIRTDFDDSSERMNYKIRQAQKQKIPYMIILGDTEGENETISIRRRDNSRRNDITVTDLFNEIQERVAEVLGE